MQDGSYMTCLLFLSQDEADHHKEARSPANHAYRPPSTLCA